MAEAKVKMCFVKYYVLIYFAVIFACNALNCRSEGGPKANELKTIYMNCLKRQDSKNSSRGYSGDDGWKDSRGHRERGDSRSRDKMGNRDNRMGIRDDRLGSRDDRLGSRDDRLSSRVDRFDNEDRINNQDDRMGNSRYDKTGGRSDMMGNRNDGYGRGDITGRDDFQSNEFGSFSGQDMTYRSSTQSPHRFKREKRTEMNSGHRSQYNPNPSSTQKPGNANSFRNEDRNSSENTTSLDMDKKACAMHCFLENLEMTGDNGMPDRYLVTHGITKDVKNEDLKDFLQESIEECFQILDNENTEDKCEFSKNLLMCMSEKGRANCDDWKDDIQF